MSSALTLPSYGCGVASGLGEIRYARVRGRHIAFAAWGSGEPDLLLVNESVLPMEALSQHPAVVAYLDRLARWGRVVVFDRWGVGLSDPVPPSGVALDDWVDDVAAVMDAVRSVQAAVFASGPSAGLIALRFASRHPERTSSLCLYDAIPRYRWAPDYPFGVTAEEETRLDSSIDSDWGSAQLVDRRGRLGATAARHPDIIEWAVTWFRRGASPNTMRALNDVLHRADVRDELDSITTPTLVLNHRGVEDGVYLAQHMPNAKYVELANDAHLVFSDDLDVALAAVATLLGTNPVDPIPDRRLATVLFTDIVDSTPALSAIGDRRWAHELDRHERSVRRQIERFAGHEVGTTGDGFVATFDGPTQAVRCALAIQHDLRADHIRVRAGVHIGEIERRGNDIAGITVHIAQRVCGQAAGGQVLVTDRVVDLTGGSDLQFSPYAIVELKGLENRWSLHLANARSTDR